MSKRGASHSTMLHQKYSETGRGIASSPRLFSLVIVLVVGLECGPAFSRNPSESVAPKASDIVKHLTETITWYRGASVEQQIANERGDIPFLNDNRRISGQIVRLAFDFARSEEKNESTRRPKSGETQTGTPSQYERLSQAVANADRQVEQTQSELQSLRQKLEAAPERKRAALEPLIAETQSELAFQQAHRDALHNMLEFASTTGTGDMGPAGLRARIEELARSLPAALTRTEGTSPEQLPAEQVFSGKPPTKNREELFGIWALGAEVWKLSRKKETLGQRIDSTDQLIEAAKQFRAPLVANLKNLIQSGDQLAEQAPSNNPTVLAQQKKQLDALTTQFKQASAGLMPLGKQAILLNLYKRTLTSWREGVRNDYNDKMQSLLIRLGILVMIVALVFAAGEAWRRTIFRYIHEPRRRYQFLLLRKIMIWIAVVTIVAFTFASQLGSVATFAGLLTAGVAVALQSVILSVAGYFFLMGKYGIRVGDRVQIGGVTGEVVDVGLVRFHLLELSSGGTDAQPSGRVVAFSNSVVFQPTSGVFKRIPGASFVWHEINLTFSHDNNYRTIQERITSAVDHVLKDHHEEMDRQRRHMEQTLNSISEIELRPKTYLRFTPSGIEVTVRFPVDLKSAADIDDCMMRELYATIEQEPRLKLAESGIPKLRTDLPPPNPA